MKELPSNVKAYKKTPIFTDKTLPAGLLKAHTTKAGVWGKVCIIRGKILYVIETEPPESVELSPTLSGIVEPEKPHRVEPLGEAEFFVEFYK